LAPANRPDIPDYKPLALYETEIAKKGAPSGVMKGTTAFASGEFGKGRVFCFSPHPEKTKGLEPFLGHAIAWAAEAKLQKAAVQKPRVKWAIVLHGGAGNPPKDATPEQLKEYRHGLREALEAGKSILEKDGSSLDAVEAVIRKLEDNPLFNAGRGAVFNSAGGHELDASIMDGKTLDGGAVAGVKTVKNPISLARKVMDQTRHVLLSGEGAETFATEQNAARVPNESFSTDLRRKEWQKVQASERKENTARFSPPEPWQYGTVGCVALDASGNLAAGTSTGGLTNKKFGRVGDSPILGAGTYADNETCGLSASGIGEQFIRHTACAQISQLMRYKSWTLQQSAEHVLKTRLRPGDGGIIGIDHTGEIVWVYTTPGMFRAAADASGRLDVLIRDE
jgi:beta-aspartyl-peptidase (threonine type)